MWADLEQALAAGGRQVGRDAHGARALPEHRHAARVATKGLDVALHPLQRQPGQRWEGGQAAGPTFTGTRLC